jgi:hypothetical protein
VQCLNQLRHREPPVTHSFEKSLTQYHYQNYLAMYMFFPGNLNKLHTITIKPPKKISEKTSEKKKFRKKILNLDNLQNSGKTSSCPDIKVLNRENKHMKDVALLLLRFLRQSWAL